MMAGVLRITGMASGPAEPTARRAGAVNLLIVLKCKSVKPAAQYIAGFYTRCVPDLFLDLRNGQWRPHEASRKANG